MATKYLFVTYVSCDYQLAIEGLKCHHLKNINCQGQILILNFQICNDWLLIKWKECQIKLPILHELVLVSNRASIVC